LNDAGKSHFLMIIPWREPERTAPRVGKYLPNAWQYHHSKSHGLASVWHHRCRASIEPVISSNWTWNLMAG
jgi:hypothetical protein